MNSAIKLKVFRGCNILNITTKFSERLKKLRESNNMNCTQLAKQLNVSSASIGYYEKGERVPDLEVLARICEFFNVSSDYLIGISDFASKDIEKKAVADYIGLDEKSVDEIIETTSNVLLKDAAQMFIGKHFQFFMELLHQIEADSGGFMIEFGEDNIDYYSEVFNTLEPWDHLAVRELYFKKEFDRYQVVKYAEKICDDVDETRNLKQYKVDLILHNLEDFELKYEKNREKPNAQHNET